MTIRSRDVVKFAPILLFHPDEEFLPTSIESLLKGARIIEKDSKKVVDTHGRVTRDDMLWYRNDRCQIEIA